MNGSDAQIKRAYEEGSMTPKQIADDLGFEEVAVKAKLCQLSAQYRKDCKMEPEEEDVLNFSNEQLRKVNDVIYQCAISATLPDGTPDYRTQLKASTYVRDDKKGRLEVVKGIQGGPTFNILQQFNESLQNARALATTARQKVLVDV